MQNKIKDCRVELGVSQEQLANESGVARTVISQLESGTRDVITTDTMVKLSKALNRPVSDIFLLE